MCVRELFPQDIATDNGPARRQLADGDWQGGGAIRAGLASCAVRMRGIRIGSDITEGALRTRQFSILSLAPLAGRGCPKGG
ncbi:hypothetical protein GCM10027430_06990 [Lysobacter tyrosinilyticus]